MPENWQIGGFGLYVHWPFCQAKCPYCDFNSHVSRQIDQSAWLRAYVSEIERWSRLTPGRILRSIYFGGGTPSLMDAATVDAVISTAERCWTFSNDIEITLEANPTSVEADKFADYRAAGVNRVSVGVQAMNDGDLKALGRLHSVDEAILAIEAARNCFDRVNFDLIYARQNQGIADWSKELSRALELGPDHLSLYQLTIEDRTAFGDRHKAGGLRGLPDEDLAADLFEVTQDLASAAGLNAYEVSNHAKPGCESRHNLIYWSGGDYVGIGPGAHGRISTGRQRSGFESVKSPGGWLNGVNSGALRHERCEGISPRDAGIEYVMMALRTRLGADLGRFEGCELRSKSVDAFCGSGHLTLSEGWLRATDKGRPILNYLLREILPG